VAVTLELARICAKADVVPTIKFIGFGAEDISGPKATNHHYGSRYYAKKMSKTELAKTEGMLSIDMVGVGKKLTVHNRAEAARTVEKSLIAYGKKIKQSMTYVRDNSKDGYSDHEAFEGRGIPSVLLEWKSDPNYHTSKDTYSRISKTAIKKTGVLVRGWLDQMTAKKLNALKK
jgi:Zn-dependent M28 family amino/carboxypeptidase